jgi:putative peptidoglycan lipid II flippase
MKVLATPIVALIFERGRFTPDDTAATATALLFYAPGLIGYSAVKIAVPSFYALKDSRTPTTIAIATMAANVAINVTLVRVMGYRGLALGTAIAAWFNAATLLWMLRRRIGGLEGAALARAAAKITCAALVMGAVSWGTERALHGVMPGDDIAAQLVRLMSAIGGGILTLGAAARVLRIHEFEQVLAMETARLRRRVHRS